MVNKSRFFNKDIRSLYLPHASSPKIQVTYIVFQDLQKLEPTGNPSFIF